MHTLLEKQKTLYLKQKWNIDAVITKYNPKEKNTLTS